MKKIFKKTLVFTLAACMLFATACGDDGDSSSSGNQTGATDSIKDTNIVLAQNGQSDYTVVVPLQATPAEEYAADLLVEQFSIATGVILTVHEDNGQALDENKKVISVGRTSVLQDSGLTVSESDLTCDGYKLKRYGNTVVLCGAADSGTIFSVIDFLHYQFGYEVYAAYEIYIEDTELSYVKDYDFSGVPDFWGRETDGYLMKYPEAALGMKMRTLHMKQESWGKGSSEDWIGGHCESWKNILPESKYNNPDLPETYHPEWYSVRQICLTNEELIAEFIKNVKELVLANPNARVINLSEEDHGAIATCCKTCEDEANRYGLSGHVIRFCNKIITAIESWLDEEGIDREFEYTTFAYSSGTWTPPVEYSEKEKTYVLKDESCRPHEKLYIRLAPLWLFCYQHSFNDPTCKLNVEFKTKVDGWLAVTNHFYVWDYAGDYSAYLPFYNIFGTLQENMRWYKELGVTNIFRQDTTGEAFNSFSQLRAYLTAKLMWDVDTDVDAATKNFFTNFYKSGADYMYQYYTLMRSHCMMMDAQSPNGQHIVNYFMLDPTQWPISVLEKALSLIEKAAETYESMKTTNPDQYDKMYVRVLQESVCVRFMILENYASYYNINSARYTQMLDQFEIDAYRVGIFSYAEGQGIGAWIASKRTV